MHQLIHVAASLHNDEAKSNFNHALKLLTKNPSLRMAYGANKWRQADGKFDFQTMYPAIKSWAPDDVRNVMNDPQFARAFGQELSAAMSANVCVVILPADFNAVLMAAFMAGLGKKVVALILADQPPALMLGTFAVILTSWQEFEDYFLIPKQ